MGVAGSAATPPPPVEPGPPVEGSVLGTAAALLPGVVLHGAGHWAAGNRKDAWTLLKMEGAGLALFIGGMGLLTATAASDEFGTLYVATPISGLAIVALSWLGDIMGAAHGSKPWPAPERPPGELSLAVGYTGLFGDPFALDHGLDLQATWQTDRWRIAPWGLFTTGDRYRAYGGEVGYRFWRPDDPLSEASVVFSLGYQDFAADRFTMTTGEAYGELRENLGHLVGTLRNVYALARVGYGLVGYGYAATGQSNGLSALILEAGLGVWATPQLNLELIYEQSGHRLPGGIVGPTGLASFVGQFQISGRLVLGQRWAVLPGVRLGEGVMPWVAVEASLF